MSFLKNNKVYIDAILTDEGRRRMAAGNFEVRLFSLHDDEIDYAKHLMTSGEAKFAATPIFEAISENSRALKHELLTVGMDTTHLISTRIVSETHQGGTPQATGNYAGSYILLSRKSAYDNNYSTTSLPAGHLKAYEGGLVSENPNSWIYIDHGVNDGGATGPHKWDDILPAELSEAMVTVKLDYRIGRIIMPNGGGMFLEPISIDDDHVATYVMSAAHNSDTRVFFEQVQKKESASPIQGARGLRTRIPVVASPHINVASTTIWTDLGKTVTNFFNGSANAYMIETSMTVEGDNTNYNMTVPLKFVKNV